MVTTDHRRLCHPWTGRHLQAGTSPLRVLIVDDNVNAAEALGTYLGCGDMVCRLAFGGAQAVRVGTDWRPHVVIMDISMPECNGFQAARALRQDERTSGSAIIAFTALDETEVRKHLIDGEFDGYCQKGHGPAHLTSLIASLMH
jgi:two-component system OmpR family response regulator